MKRDIRSTARTPEIQGDDATPRLFGHAALFDSESLVMFDPDVLADADGNALPFVEVIASEAFTRSLRANPDVVALYNHDTSDVLGRTSSGTLELGLDDLGLWFNCWLPDTTAGRDARTLVKRGDIRGCSFGFSVREDRVEVRAGLPALRTLLEVDLFEVTIATAFPAYPATTTEARTLEPRPSHDLGIAAHYNRLRRLLVY
jgi:HK97 family phage prohead protease